jgi:hypothetical protein
MKKYFLMAVVATAILFTSCSKDETPTVVEKDVLVTIKLGGVQPRSVEAPATQGQLKMENGWIYVVAPDGTIRHHERLNITAAVGAGTTTDGQTLNRLIASDSRIYIIGNFPNLPATGDISPIPTTGGINGIKSVAASMSTQTDYTKAALANTGDPVAIILTGGRIPTGEPNAGAEIANVTVDVKPLISRVELAEVVGAGNIIGYDVTGVFIDDTYPSFVWGGGHHGDIRSQGTNTTFTVPGDITGTPGTLDWGWPAVPAGTDKYVASPGGSDVWAHNVAPAHTPFNPQDGYLMPRFLIRVENVETNPGFEKPAPVYYLTVRRYNADTATGAAITYFKRGKIYQVGGPKGSHGFEFNEDNLEIVPNLEDVQLEVEVTVIDWIPVVIIPGL